MNDHGFIDGFAHVVDGEGGDGNGGEGFHFDASFRGGGGGGLDLHFGFCEVELDIDLVEREAVAEGDEAVGYFRGLDAGDAGDGEDIAFRDGFIA